MGGQHIHGIGESGGQIGDQGVIRERGEGNACANRRRRRQPIGKSVRVQQAGQERLYGTAIRAAGAGCGLMFLLETRLSYESRQQQGFELVGHLPASLDDAVSIDGVFGEFREPQNHQFARGHLIAMTGRAIVFEGIAHQGPLVGVGAMACQAGRGRSFRIAGIGEILPEMACVIEFNRRAAVVGETIRELRVGLREVGEFFLVTGRALKIVERDDVGVHTLVLGMAHQAGGLRHIGPAGGFPVMGQSSRAFKAVTVGAIGGHVARCEHRLDPVHAAAVVIHMAHLAVGVGDEIRMGVGQGSGNCPIEADDVTVGRPHGTADKG